MAADAAITEAVGLWLDESLLTGESLPVARTDPGQRVLAGSLVAGGRGWATVVAVDKTGTLTENRIGVQQLLTWPELKDWQAGAPLEEPFHQLMELAVLASRGDPVDAMELAIQRLAADQLGDTEHLHPDWPLEQEYPLQSDLLVFSRLWRDGDGNLRLAAKGAPEAIADLCHLDGERSATLLAAADGLAARGLRVLAVARGLEGVAGALRP